MQILQAENRGLALGLFQQGPRDAGQEQNLLQLRVPLLRRLGFGHGLPGKQGLPQVRCQFGDHLFHGLPLGRESLRQIVLQDIGEEPVRQPLGRIAALAAQEHHFLRRGRGLDFFHQPGLAQAGRRRHRHDRAVPLPGVGHLAAQEVQLFFPADQSRLQFGVFIRCSIHGHLSRLRIPMNLVSIRK